MLTILVSAAHILTAGERHPLEHRPLPWTPVQKKADPLSIVIALGLLIDAIVTQKRPCAVVSSYSTCLPRFSASNTIGTME